MAFLPDFKPSTIIEPMAIVGLALATIAATKYCYNRLADPDKTKAKIIALSIATIASAYLSVKLDTQFWVGPGLVSLGSVTIYGLIRAPLLGKIAILSALTIPISLTSQNARLALFFGLIRVLG